MSGAATLVSPGEDQIFDTVWGFLAVLFDPSLSSNIRKFDQNFTPSPFATYAIISPGIVARQDQAVRSYTPPTGSPPVGAMNVSRGTQYCYQVDCYGPAAPDWANTIAIAWRSLWACEYFASGVDVNNTPLKALGLAPLYADEPQQLNFVNGEQQYEQRFMTKLYIGINEVVALVQPMFNSVTVVTEPPVA